MAKAKKKTKKKKTPTTDFKPKAAAKFVIHYDAAAEIRYVAAIGAALGQMGATSVVQDGTNNCFKAKLKWGTSLKDRGNLKGRLNLAANNAVVRVAEG
jgi:hypothetical protein